MVLGIKNVAVFFCIALMATTCCGRQSGSRGGSSGGSVGGGQSFAAPAQNFAAPVQNFTTPSQNFAAPAQNFSSQPLGSSFNGSAINASPQTQFNQPAMFQRQPQPMSQMQPMTRSQSGGSGSSSPGIQESSLVDPVFEIHSPSSTLAIDHSIWNNFLATYLTTDRRGVNRIYYRNVSFDDRQLLANYLQQLQATDTRMLNRSEQLAFWFNLYNAKTVALVLQHYPIRSIRQIKQKLTDFVGPFDDAGAVRVNNVPLSLNDIESGIVRPVFNDPRIHYALNCASYGCPNLSPTAWTSHDIDARLNGAAYEYINSRRAVRPGLFGPRLSKIYKWYKSDFGESDAGVIQHLQGFANDSTANTLNGQTNVSGYFYDWSLNDARILRPRLLEAWRR